MRQSSRLKIALLSILGLVAVLISVLLFRTWTLADTQPPPSDSDPFSVDREAAAKRLSRTITHRTLSTPAPKPEVFQALHAELAALFPQTHQQIAPENINQSSLLFTWPGRDTQSPGVLLLAHLDVVPVEPATLKDWTYPPYSGAIKDGFIWGRGTMDFKVGATALLEAVEGLISKGFQPERTVYLAFGHDEEVGGEHGAKAMAQQLKAQGIKLEMVLDEGLVVAHQSIPGIQSPVALIGLAEKGYLSLQLTAKAAGGHSSSPGRTTAAGRIGRAVARLEAEPFEARLTVPTRAFFKTLAPHFPFATRLAAANLWLLGGAVASKLAANPGAEALMRTTTAVTMLQGSPKDNILPQQATAVVNFRILPGDTKQSVRQRVIRIIDDPQVKVTQYGAFSSDPSAVSSATSAAYRVVAHTARQIFPDALVAPSLMIAATDSRHFQSLSPAIFRFSPQRMYPQDRPRFHGTNERQSVKGYVDMVRFYAQLFRNLGRMGTH